MWKIIQRLSTNIRWDITKRWKWDLLMLENYTPSNNDCLIDSFYTNLCPLTILVAKIVFWSYFNLPIYMRPDKPFYTLVNHFLKATEYLTYCWLILFINMKLLASTVGVNTNSYNLGFLDIDNNKSISLLSLVFN